MKERIIERLEQLGYLYTIGDDEFLLDYIIAEKTQYILNYCNISTIPTELEYVLINLVCADFFQTKKVTGKDVGIDTNGVKQIKEGDITIQYADASSNFDILLAKLNDTSELKRFRRIKW